MFAFAHRALPALAAVSLTLVACAAPADDAATDDDVEVAPVLATEPKLQCQISATWGDTVIDLCGGGGEGGGYSPPTGTYCQACSPDPTSETGYSARCQTPNGRILKGKCVHVSPPPPPPPESCGPCQPTSAVASGSAHRCVRGTQVRWVACGRTDDTPRRK